MIPHLLLFTRLRVFDQCISSIPTFNSISLIEYKRWLLAARIPELALSSLVVGSSGMSTPPWKTIYFGLFLALSDLIRIPLDVAPDFVNEVTRHSSYYYYFTQELLNESVDSESRDG